MFLLLHGGGHTALSWALVTKELKRHHRVIALDLRGHGFTTVDNEDDLSMATMVEDVVRVLAACGLASAEVVVAGHSMGGALAVHVASDPRVRAVGVVVLDVVEGTAIAALGNMTAVLDHRPNTFPTVQAAIHWSLSSGMLRRVESACISIPPLLRRVEGGGTRGARGLEIVGGVQAMDLGSGGNGGNVGPYTWRTDLKASASHWRGWFEGLSQRFLKCPGRRMLILAGPDRLDKELTIAQMQGKYQLVMLPNAGHCIMEDAPLETAKVMLQFAGRYNFGKS